MITKEQKEVLERMSANEIWLNAGHTAIRAALDTLNAQAEVIDEVHAWAVCGCIASPEDMMQNISRIVEITAPDPQVPQIPQADV